MLLIDAHVHIYDCFELEKFFDSAYANFKSAAERLGYGNDFTGILLLAETSKDKWFHYLADYADGKDLPEGKDTGSWKFHHTTENHSLRAESGDSKDLLLIAGRQIVTEEGLEVLACGTVENFRDGMSIDKIIEQINNKGGLPIIPWAVGKWLGAKGKIIKNIINNSNSSSSIYLGDNGNRPGFWPQPRLLAHAISKGIPVLPGSDPLPFVSEFCRAGSYGFLMQIQIDPQKPAMHIKQNLMAKINNALGVFGRLERIHRFVLNQIRAQIRKRITRENLN